MTASPDASTGTTPALTAFLRGVERRGALFGELLAGSREAGDDGLRAAIAGFGAVAGRTRFGDWPSRFWSLLLASPSLRKGHHGALWHPPFDALAGIGLGPRAALLLRLVAGLGEADAAAVLGVAQPTYRLALQRALPHLEDGTPDLATWDALAHAAREALKTLPPERLAHVALVREHALHGDHDAPGGRERHPPGRRRWLPLALSSVAVATATALLATVWWPGLGMADAGGRIRIEPLPPAEAPAARYDVAAALATHPDFDLLLDPPEPAAVDPGFFAWYAASSASGTPGADGEPPAVAADPSDAQVGVDDPGLESQDAPR